MVTIMVMSLMYGWVATQAGHQMLSHFPQAPYVIIISDDCNTRQTLQDCLELSNDGTIAAHHKACRSCRSLVLTRMTTAHDKACKARLTAVTMRGQPYHGTVGATVLQC